MDTREDIMARIVVLMGGIVGVDQVSRNVLVGDDSKQKRITILEGDEEAAESDPVNRPANAPRIVFMRPQILISAIASSDNIGSDLSTLRGKVMNALSTDTTLVGLTLNGRGARYVGMESDLAFAREMLGQMALKFELPYILRPDQF